MRIAGAARLTNRGRLTKRGVALHWVRWGLMHGVPRAGLTSMARQGDPFAELMLGVGPAADPYLTIERIRARGVVSTGRVGLVTADHELIRTLLRDKRFVTFAPQNLPLPRWARLAFDVTEPGLPNPVEPPAMLAVDPPEHTRYRKLVSRAFTPRALAALDARIVEVTESLLDDLAERDQVDLVADFAAKLPVAIIAEMLEVPVERAPMLLEWGAHGASLLDVGISWRAYRQAADSLVVFDRFLDDHVATLRARGGDGILSTVIADDDLSPRELNATAALLLGAGFETTVNLIGNGIVALTRHPEQLDLLRADPDGWPNAIEEILRFDSPVQLTGRIAAESVDLPQYSFGSGDAVVMLLGGANRDPAVFDAPDRFDIARENARDHLAFSSGVHACLGASLARKEGAIALAALFDRYPNLRLTGPPTPRELVNLHGYERLPAALHGRRAADAVPVRP